MANRHTGNIRISKKVSKKVIGILLAFIFMVCLFAFITYEIFSEKEVDFDNAIFGFLHQSTSPAVTRFFTFITFFGSTSFLLPAYLALSFYYLFFKKNTRLSLYIATIGITSTALLRLAKFFFQRHRPIDPLITAVTGFSFPSGHSFSSFTLCGLIIYIIWMMKISLLIRLLVISGLFIFATLIAVSRVYLHVHYASDVFAGFCLSIIWLMISMYVLKLSSIL